MLLRHSLEHQGEEDASRERVSERMGGKYSTSGFPTGFCCFNMM